MTKNQASGPNNQKAAASPNSRNIMEEWLTKQDKAVEKTYRALRSKRTPPEEKEITAANYLDALRCRQR
jgi:hypothetical protein